MTHIMQYIFKSSFSIIWLICIVFFCFACNGFSKQSQITSNNDSTLNEVVFEKNVKKTPLSDKWDSLMRNQIIFHLDSVNPVSIKVQKKQLKDSLIKEFAKKPKHVYLTFDDGPLVGSFAIDSLAKAKNVKLNAFLVGRHANMSKARKKDLQNYLNNPLIACYNHSYTHANNRFQEFYNNVDNSYADFIKNQNDLGLDKKVIRLPGRNIWIYNEVRKIDLNNGSATADKLFEDGYKIFGWDVEWRINSLSGVPVQSLDATYAKMRNMVNNPNIVQTPNNAVLLMHDDMFQTKKGRKLLANLIDSLIKNDYQFEFMEDYPIRY